jgi:tetratricopeptide (TPR) repeat protein
MMKLKNLLSVCCLIAIGVLMQTNAANAQCETWIGNPEEGAITDAHTIYRGHMKSEEYDSAFEFWKVAYDGAPAADGERDFHYTDGIKIYKNKLKNATTDAEKEEHVNMILKLYDDAIACFESGAIKMAKMDSKVRIAYLQGRKAYDMYYELRTPYDMTLPALEKAIELGGNDTEYIVLTPYADIVTYEFSNENLDKAKAREAYDKINQIADYNVKNNAKYGPSYKQAKESAMGTFAPFDTQIFDCDFFVKKIEPVYRADPDNPEVLKETIQTLKRQGCDASNPLLAEVEAKWSKYAAGENAKRQAEFEANNPAMLAKKAYDSGDYAGAIAKYRQAANDEADPAKKAEYFFRVASIQGRKLKKYSDARKTALKAAQTNPGYGRPYMLIGDLYASSSRNCTDDNFMQRCAVLAAINMYSKAKSVDSSVASEANSRISKYQDSKPTKDEAFMRGFKSGQKVKVKCWIGESVTLNF